MCWSRLNAIGYGFLVEFASAVQATPAGHTVCLDRAFVDIASSFLSKSPRAPKQCRSNGGICHERVLRPYPHDYRP